MSLFDDPPAPVDPKTVPLPERMRPRTLDEIVGQDDVIEQTLITLLAGGHGLLIGVPGLAKTKLVESLGTVLGLDMEKVGTVVIPQEATSPRPNGWVRMAVVGLRVSVTLVTGSFTLRFAAALVIMAAPLLMTQS